MNNISTHSNIAYILGVIAILILLVIFRSKVGKFSLHSPKKNHSIAFWLIIFWGLLALIEYLGGFIINLKKSGSSNNLPDILFQSEYPEKFQELMVLHIFLFLALLLAYILLATLDKTRKKSKKITVLVDRKREAVEKTKNKNW